MKPLTIDEIRREVALAVANWKPDPGHIEVGDRYFALAVQCWAGCLSDSQISERLRDFVDEERTP